MKQFKLFLAAALLFGIGSAFTNVQSSKSGLAYGNDGTRWIQVDPAQIGVTYDCVQGTSFCLYEEPNFDHPIGMETKLFIPLGD
jgi:Family of unknown function (DUF6520)